MADADVLIVGQGLAGSILAFEFERSGLQTRVMDDGSLPSSSKVAAGIYNPITGRLMKKTWLADEIFPSIAAIYEALEEVLGVRFHYSKPIYRPFLSLEEQHDWMGRSAQGGYQPFIKEIFIQPSGFKHVIDPFGGVMLDRTGYVEVAVLLGAFNRYFRDRGMLVPKLFEVDKLEVGSRLITYEDINVGRIFFCDGPAVINNPYWSDLRFKPVKGELLDIECEVEPNLILNRGVFMIPRENFVTVGSTYDHRHLDWKPRDEGIDSIIGRMSRIFAGKYRILKARAGVRPATFDRKPFVGFHPEDNRIGIFNGFGTKGVSLIPFFARQLKEHIVEGGRLMPEVSVTR